MTPSSRWLTALGLASALSAATPLAAAATNTASVLITSFSFTTSGGTLSWSDPYQSFDMTARNAGGLGGTRLDSFTLSDYGFAVAGASTSTSTAAASTTTPQTFWATASSASSVGPLVSQPNQAEAIVNQSGSFALSGAGSVTFSVGYQLAVSALGGNAVTDYGSALLAFDAADTDGGSNGRRTDSLMSFAQGSGVASRSGTFMLTVDLAAGETGFYNLQGNALAYATAALPVPEPTSWALFAAGLAGVATLRLRQRRQ